MFVPHRPPRQSRKLRRARTFAPALAGALTLIFGIGVSPSSAADAATEREFDIPTAATVRALGDISPGTCPESILPFACKEDSPEWPFPGITFPLTVPGLGVPLGGIGAGSFMVNQSGTLGPWFFTQAAFHVREQVGTEPAQVRTLATNGASAVDYKGDEIDERSWEDPLPAWNRLNVGEAQYAALYPFGWMNYTPFQTDVSMRFYSPIVAGDDRRSSLPVAYFDVQISNTTTETAKVSTMFTMPNVGGHVGRQPETVREGLTSSYTSDEASGIHAVTLSSDSEANTPDAYKSEWTIAADVQEGDSFSYTTSWDAAGDGSDVYAPFSATGDLGDEPIDASSSAGAIAVSAELAPGETRTIPFVLTWDFPQVAFNDNGTVWMRHYTNYYGAQTTDKNDYIPGSYPFHQSFKIAQDALNERDQNLADVHSWWDPIVQSTSIPDVLKEAALNQLANVSFHTVVWEGGLVRNNEPVVSGGDRIGSSIPGTHNYLGIDAASGGISTLGQGGEVGIYSYSVYADLFPTIERDRMRNKAETILSDTSFGDPWDFGNGGDDNPFIVWNQGTDSGPGLAWFLDRPAINVFRMYDYAQRNDDDEFLAFVYPAMKKTFAYLQKTIPSDYALPEVPSANHPSPDLLSPFPMSNIYNGEPVNRFDSYTSSLYILSIEAMIAAGERVGEDPAVVADLEADLVAARSDFDKLFWLEDAGYYRYTLPEPNVVPDQAMIATFLSQQLAERAGLPDVVELQKYARHLKTIRPFVTGSVDAANRPTGAPLLGSATAAPSPNVTIEAVYAFAANMVSAGKRTGDAELVNSGLKTASEVAVQLWEVEDNGYQFNTPSFYESDSVGTFSYPSWEGNLAVWQIFDALRQEADPVAPTPTPTSDPVAPSPTPTPGLTSSPAPGSVPPNRAPGLAATGTTFDPGASVALAGILLAAGAVAVTMGRRRNSRRHGPQ